MNEIFFQISKYGHDLTLYVLVLLSILSVAFILERYFFLKKLKKHSLKNSAQIRQIMSHGDFEDLTKISKNWESLEGRFLDLGLKHASRYGSRGLSELLNSFVLGERPFLEKNLTFLASTASNAPFIGLLGTVFGVMEAFQSLATSQGEASLVMVGISKALVATAIGLFVAIPAGIFYNYFQKQVRQILQGLDSAKELCLASVLSKTKHGD